MPRDFWIQGECMVSVRGNTSTIMPTSTQLGLANEDPIKLTLHGEYEDIKVDAWGGRAPVDVQMLLGWMSVRINLVHVDRLILDACMRESFSAGGALGTLPRAGTRLGGGLPRFAVGNHYVGLNLSNTVGDIYLGPARPWRFYYAYMGEAPFEVNLGTGRSIWVTDWRIIPYTNDPWGGISAAALAAGITSAQPGTAAGTGSLGAILWDHTPDT